MDIQNFSTFTSSDNDEVETPIDELCEQLYVLLASSYTLYLKTQNFHWNVTGPFFGPLHSLFNELYDDLAEFNDLIAERIRALNMFVAGSFSQFAAVSRIQESLSVPSYVNMVDTLIVDNNIMIQLLNIGIDIAKESGEEGVISLLADRINVHKKFVWKLNSILQ